MKYGIYIGKKYANVYDFNHNSYVSIDGKDYFETPFGIYDEVNSTLSLDKFVRFVLKYFSKLEKCSEIVFGIERLNDINRKYISISFQKAGLYKNIKEAKEKISFDIIDDKINYDDVHNDNVVKRLSVIRQLHPTNTINHSYGIYDAGENNVFEVIPADVKLEDLVFNKKNCANYQYYVDVEQINNEINQFILTITEDNVERLYIHYEDKRLSGKYRIYFYVLNNFMCIDFFDLVRSEWISTDDTIEERQFEMRK